MRKFKLLLATLLASVCSIQGMRAERVAPEIPTHIDIVSSQTYYLYNVNTNEFVYYNKYKSDGSGVSKSFYKLSGFQIIEGKDSYYNLKAVEEDGNIYLNGYYNNNPTSHVYSPTLYNHSNPSSRASFNFSLTEVENGYNIGIEGLSYFVGIRDQYLRSDCDESGNILWQLLTEDQAARLALYNALVRADMYGFNVDEHESVFSNANSSNADLLDAARRLNYSLDLAKDYEVPEWSDVPVRFDEDDEGIWSYNTNSTNSGFRASIALNCSATLSSYVVVDEDATMFYTVKSGDTGYGYEYTRGYFDIYVDGVLHETLNQYMTLYNCQDFIELTPGTHTIQWKAYNSFNGTREFYVRNIGVMKSPTTSVSLLEAGSLGTEVLSVAGINHPNDVRRLIVSGPMNDNDWEKISMMTYLSYLDLSQAEVTTLPESRFYDCNRFLHSVKLPKNLEKIGKRAFYYSNLINIEFPSSLKEIGEDAFYSTKIKEAIIPEGVTSIGASAFYSCRNLTTVSYPSTATKIPYACFSGCYSLLPFNLPEGVTSVGEIAFSNAYSYNTTFPSTLKTIGNNAFKSTGFESIILPGNITSVGEYAFSSSQVRTAVLPEGATLNKGIFSSCKNLERVEFPTSFSQINVESHISGCSALKDVYFKSPTLITGNGKEGFLYGVPANVTIHVPSYLRTSYILDPYWYNYTIVGFDTGDIQDWTITQPLTLNAHDRLDGTPNVTLKDAGGMKVNGEAAQNINNLVVKSVFNASSLTNAGQLFSNCDNVAISGSYTHEISLKEKNWYFLSLPYNMQISDIQTQNGCQYAIRYYDGASRSENGSSGNWKNYEADATIPAGTGFIFQTSKDDVITFAAKEDASKQNVVSNVPFTMSLAANNSEVMANKGWNLIGNPWQCYYNIHKLNFTAPITVWNGRNRTYEAYSITDDDYALGPNQAFFVQCPDEVTEIEFPTSGRQLTDEITDQNGVKAFVPQTNSSRQLIDIVLKSGEVSDRTRVVVNEEAELGFEMTRDATKMRSMDASVPQLFSIEGSTELSINERPVADGVVKLGFLAAQAGAFTIEASRCQAESVILEDLVTGAKTDLAADSYNFTADAGTHTGRFVLRLQKGGVTGVQQIDKSQSEDSESDIYDLSGRRAANGQKGIVIVNGKKNVKK